MADKEAAASGGSSASMDAATTQIREVTKWLIGAFAAVGVALAAGSQLAEIGDLSTLRLVVAILAVAAVLAGIAGAIFVATRVLTPKAISLNRLVAEEATSKMGEEVAADPSLLLGHGETLSEFAAKRTRAIAEEDKAWSDYEAAAGEAKKALRPGVERAEAERQRSDAAMRWVISYARFLDVSGRFSTALIVMFIAAALAALGIGGFAWAAHPADKEETASPAVPSSPAEIQVELGRAGIDTLGEALGKGCSASTFQALALGGPPNALEVVTIPTRRCELHRFILTPTLGTYEATNAVELKAAGKKPPKGDS